jgi:hypothetical protein
MATEWTQEERKQAGVDLKKMYRKRGVDMLDVAYEAVMQRNRALAALILAEPLIGRDADDWRDGYSVQAATANRAVSKAIAACEKGGA